VVIDAIPLQEGLAFFTEVEGAVTIDEPAAIIVGIRTEAGIVVHLDVRVDLFA
jgi:hypothetical protein